jgi:hypothetical protein
MTQERVAVGWSPAVLPVISSLKGRILPTGRVSAFGQDGAPSLRVGFLPLARRCTLDICCNILLHCCTYEYT